MKLISYPIRRIPKNKIVNVYVFSCNHTGAVGVDHQRLAKDIRYVADDEWSRWVHLGDTAECITSDDRRFKHDQLDPRYHVECPIDLQVTDTVSTFEPIADKGIVIVRGNHEGKYIKKSESNPARRVADNLGVEYGGVTALIKMQLVSRNGSVWEPTIMAFHGTGTNATTLPGKIGYLIKKSAPFRCDVAVMGHVHSKICCNAGVELDIDKEAMKLREYDRAYGVTGTYLKTYFVQDEGEAGYGEERLYPPSALGCIRVQFHVGYREIVCQDKWFY